MNTMYLIKKPIFVLALGILVSQFLFSCVKVKDLAYLQDISATASEETVTAAVETSLYKLAPNDIISIKVVTHDIGVTQMYNVDAVVTNQLSEASLYLNGYSLDLDGSIDFPNIGKIKLVGLTVEAASLKIQEKLKSQITGAIVLVKLLSFKITVLGEVKKPGQLNIYQQNINLLQALGEVGDLNDFGDRRKILLIRKSPNGVQNTIFNIDLTSKSFLSSEQFHLRPNDVLYVPPIKQKTNTLNASTTTVIVSSLSALSVIASVIVNVVLAKSRQ